MKMAAGEQLKEKDVFIRHYASLCSTVTDINTLLPYFVSENIISISDHEKIISDPNVTNSEKVVKLLSHISGPLEAGDAKGFHKMLDIMKERGNQGTKDLAVNMNSEMISSNSEKEYEVVNDSHQVSSDISHHHSPGSAASNTVTTPDPLSEQFSRFVVTIEALLEKCHDKLEQSKQFCSNLTINGNPNNKLLFSDEQLQEINACSTFKELFTMLRKHWCWENYSILTQIISITGLKEAKDEVELFETTMASYQGMKMIREDPSEAILLDYFKLSIFIDKPYRDLTVEKYTELRDFVFRNLDIKRYIAYPFIRYLLGSLHLEWYVLKKAAPHMIKMAQQNEEIFTSNSVVFIQVDQHVVFDYRAKDKTQIDKFDKTDKMQNELFDATSNPSILAKLQKFMSSSIEEIVTANLTQFAVKINEQNDTTLMDRLCGTKSCLTVVVLIIAISIALLLQSPHENLLVEDHTIVNTLHINNYSRDISLSDRKHLDEGELKQTPQVTEQFSEQNERSHKLDKTEVPINLEDVYRSKLNFSELQQQNTQVPERSIITFVNQYHYYQLNNLESLLSSEIPDQVAPLITKMHNFSEKVWNNEEWYSTPFFAFKGGYQMCLKVLAAGYGDGEGTHVSVFLHLMKGPHDDKLEQSGHWPLRGTFTIELLNQLNDNTHMVQFHHHLCNDCTNRVLEGFIAKAGHSIPQFISHGTLYYGDSGYYKSDSLTFRISYEDIEPPYQVAPVTFKFTHFSQWLKSEEEWYSSPFFAFEDGYQMCLEVFAAGYGDGEGTHVSVFLYLMKGPHDDKLEQSGHWPLRGIFTIELLNQLNDSDHISHMLQLHHNFCSQCTTRVLEAIVACSGCGYAQFISHDTLLHHSHNNSYYRSDHFIIRISYEHMEPPYQITPVDFKLSKFSQWFSNKEVWYSSPFFAFKEGYQLCLKVFAAGYGDGEGTHVSVYLYLMKGPHDDKLEQSGHWPLRGTFTIELLNQLNDSDHYTYKVQFHYLCSEYSVRVLDRVMACQGCGYARFISHDTLFQHSNGSHYKNDFLIFKISYEHMEPPYQITPVDFKLSKFSQWLKTKEKWYSSPFYAFEEGYQMCVTVYAAGNGDGGGTHISVYLYLMKGPHDHILEQSGHWPLRGTFTIELLNQLNDSDHYSHVLQFHHLCIECTNRVLEGTMASSGYGKPQLISHDTLLHHGDNGYYRSDSLIFRISYEDIEPPYQVAPVTFKLTKFSQWLENQEEWYSSPFFTFDGGYQISLKVYAAGDGIGEGTHVSVFLYLMKGPHDDKLEQSGHWPLRGTFTIELLNQLNDSDQYSCMVQFHHHRCSKCTNRVLEEVMAYSGRGEPQFISHDVLLHNNDYYRNDSLIFRISYEHMEPPYQITPVTFKLTKFSQWVKSEEIWLSSPFFAFNEGYQMFLSVKAAGYDEGTHVSVFLYLMKGPHDDKLEQSGHWPLRGTFTIELLDQLNDSDHYSPAVIYILSGSGKRVIGDEIDAIEAVVKYISHDTLFKHNGYLKDDTLYFRISIDDGTKGIFIRI